LKNLKLHRIEHINDRQHLLEPDSSSCEVSSNGPDIHSIQRNQQTSSPEKQFVYAWNIHALVMIVRLPITGGVFMQWWYSLFRQFWLKIYSRIEKQKLAICTSATIA